MTRSEWAELRAQVRDLDMKMVLKYMLLRAEVAIPKTPESLPCPAWVMDPDCGPCEPMWTWQQDHVKDDPRLAEKAPDDVDHLIDLCAAHDERGMKAGYQWNTAHRPEERAYLAERREAFVGAPV